MAKYLLVAHQTAQSDELIAAAAGLAREDPQADFRLLVPATPVGTRARPPPGARTVSSLATRSRPASPSRA